MRSVCGLTLSDAVEELAASIETAAGNQIRFYVSNNQHAHAESGFENGVPTVGLKRNPNLYDIAHELCHLRCRIRGLPETETLFSSSDPELTAYVCSQIQSIIEHQIIYPELVEMGFDPHEDVNNSIRSSPIISPGPMPHGTVLQSAVCLYLRATLESSDDTLKEAVDRKYRSQSQKARVLARKLERKIRSPDLQNSTQYVQLLQECFQALGVSPSDYRLVSDFGESTG